MRSGHDWYPMLRYVDSKLKAALVDVGEMLSYERRLSMRNVKINTIIVRDRVGYYFFFVAAANFHERFRLK